ncbi:inositol monophosphatase family protein [Actinoplanes sp. NPDC049599]|uniref:inositol monophosphatase family protein n=1 Tax=Actinoplanes sp. NPDC049599 TaxID=3363903 RepID=UPI003798A5B3
MTTAAVDHQALLAVAVEVVTAAAEAILARSGKRSALSYKSSATDPVTEADLASASAIHGGLSRLRPQDGLLSEDGDQTESRNGLRWVADPLDGTVNYLHGIPNVAISLACERYVDGDWQAVVAVARDVHRRELFTAVLDGGSFCDGVPMAVTDPVPAEQALIGTEYGYSVASRTRQTGAMAKLAPRVADLRTSGSTVLDLCWTAAGRLDGFIEDELGRWDWAAGALLVTEAGGRVSPVADGVLAGGPHLHRELSRLL